MIELRKYIKSHIEFDENELEVFTSLFDEVCLRKKQYFAIEGEYSSKLAYISSGVMRAFYRDKSGKEYNKTFFTSASFVAAYSSITTGEKNLINIQCLTDCILLVADFKQISSLYPKYPKFESLARIMAEYKFSIKEKREIELVTLEASDRYEIFKNEHPGLENLISQYHIASYLGISATQLSRIRAKR